MNPIKDLSFRANGNDYIIIENWSSGKLTYANKKTGKLHYSTVEKFNERQHEFERI